MRERPKLKRGLVVQVMGGAYKKLVRNLGPGMPGAWHASSFGVPGLDIIQESDIVAVCGPIWRMEMTHEQMTEFTHGQLRSGGN